MTYQLVDDLDTNSLMNPF